MKQLTSQLSLFDTIYEGKVGKRQKQVLDYLSTVAYANNRVISANTGLPINVITPRVNELVKLGLVIEHSKTTDPVTNRLAINWKLNDFRK